MRSRPTLRLKSWSVPPELDVARCQRHRVVGLGERVEELVHGDGLARLVALLEIPPLEHARHVVAGRPGGRGLRRRAALSHSRLKRDLGPLAVEDLEDLLLVGLGVRARSPRGSSGGRVFDLPVGSPIMPVKSPITKTTRWPRSWKCAHLAHEHGVAEVEVGRGGVEAHLHREGPPAGELLAERLGGDDVDAAPGQVGEALFHAPGLVAHAASTTTRRPSTR